MASQWQADKAAAVTKVEGQGTPQLETSPSSLSRCACQVAERAFVLTRTFLLVTMATLDAIAAQPDQKNKIEQYKTVLQQTVSSGRVQECQKFADHSNESLRICGLCRLSLVNPA